MIERESALRDVRGPVVLTAGWSETAAGVNFVGSLSENLGRLSWATGLVMFSGSELPCAIMWVERYKHVLADRDLIRVTLKDLEGEVVGVVTLTTGTVTCIGRFDPTAVSFFRQVRLQLTRTDLRELELRPQEPLMLVEAETLPPDRRVAVFFRRVNSVLHFRRKNGAYSLAIGNAIGFEKLTKILEEGRWYRVVYHDTSESMALENTLNCGKLGVEYVRDQDGQAVGFYLQFMDPSEEESASARTQPGRDVENLLRFLAVAFDYVNEGHALAIRDLADFVAYPTFPVHFERLPVHDNCLSGIGPCPQCGQHEKLLVHTKQWLALTDEGTDVFDDAIESPGNIDISQDDEAVCPACSYRGKVKEWQPLE